MEELEFPNFPFWSRYYFDFEEMGLTDEQLGCLTRLMASYQFRGIDRGEELPTQLRYLWICLRRDLDCAREKYRIAVENGKKGGRKRTKAKPEETRQNQEQTQGNPTKPESKTDSSFSFEKERVYTAKSAGGGAQGAALVGSHYASRAP